METIFGLVRRQGTLKKYPIESGILIRRFPIGSQAETDKKAVFKFNRWYPDDDSMTTSDALRGLSLTSYKIGVIVGLSSDDICHSINETKNLFFNFPVDVFLQDYPTFKFEFSPDFTHDTLTKRGFCHVTLHIDPDNALSIKNKKSIWRSARTFLVAYADAHPTVSFALLPT